MFKLILFAVVIYFGYRYVKRSLLPPPPPNEPVEEYPEFEVLDDDDEDR